MVTKERSAAIVAALRGAADEIEAGGTIISCSMSQSAMDTSVAVHVQTPQPEPEAPAEG